MTRRACAFCLILLVLIGCTLTRQSEPQSRVDTDSEPNQPQHHYLHKETQPHAAHWSYEGATGPEHWGDLSPAYILAKTGQRQSPIDIHGARPADLLPIEFVYKPARVDLIYNGHTIQETEEEGSYIRVDHQRFDLKQFHFHAPSEHTVSGKHYDMEMHLVHKSPDEHLAVVGVFMKAGRKNVAFAPVWNDLPNEEHPHRESNVTVDTEALLPQERHYFHYSGSLTTPPCTEEVSWFVLSEPVEMSSAQISRFCAIINGNNRPVQPLNDREIVVSVEGRSASGS